MEKLCMIYITAFGKEEAEKIGEAIVTKRLAACANVYDNITSFYWWDDKMQNGSEAVVILKTRESLFSEITKEVRNIHSYACPCIASIPLTRVSDDYAEWILRETKIKLDDQNEQDG